MNINNNKHTRNTTPNTYTIIQRSPSSLQVWVCKNCRHAQWTVGVVSSFRYLSNVFYMFFPLYPFLQQNMAIAAPTTSECNKRLAGMFIYLRLHSACCNRSQKLYAHHTFERAKELRQQICACVRAWIFFLYATHTPFSVFFHTHIHFTVCVKVFVRISGNTYMYIHST